MDRTQKEAFVSELRERMERAPVLYLTDFTGLNVQAMTELRSSLKKSGAEYMVVKNRLAKRVFAESDDLPDIGDSPTADEAIDEVDTWLRTMGWQVSADAPDRIVLAHALLVMREMGREESAVDFQPWAEAAMRLAEHEVGTIEGAKGRADAVERMVVGTVVHGQVLGALRRLATWHVQPHMQVSLVAGRARLQLRLEVPRAVNGVSVPLLFGLSLPGI